ncbi:MAG: hypothetical protein HYY60_03155 [Parcubacteria group bacterium]|nr:hypothetical protein [Parcubacteria group bacterium]
MQSTQDFVPIKEIRDRIVILKDGSFRVLLMASSVNLALKSADEQQATLLQFQNFLNSLDFSVQFFVQSRKLDIRPYTALLEEQQRKQTSDLMKIQVHEYIGFIKQFTESVNVMTKTFFIVIPYAPQTLTVQNVKGLAKLLPWKKTATENGERASLEAFEEHKAQMEQRAGVVEQGLASSGVRVAQLGSEELVELYYKIFNPGELEKPAVAGR